MINDDDFKERIQSVKALYGFLQGTRAVLVGSPENRGSCINLSEFARRNDLHDVTFLGVEQGCDPVERGFALVN